METVAIETNELIDSRHVVIGNDQDWLRGGYDVE